MMRTKNILLLSVLVVMAAFLTLGCTGSSSGSQQPSVTTTAVVPDNASVPPAENSSAIVSDTPADNVSGVPTIAPADDLNGTIPGDNASFGDNISANVTDDIGMVAPYNDTSIPADDLPYNGST